MNKSMKPTKPTLGAPAKPLTEEEKKMRIAQFLQQKRETFAVNILCNLCRCLNQEASSAHAKAMVHLSVEMADELLESLYPTTGPESEKSNNN